MIVTWERFCKRRKITLGDLVQAHGLDYDGICSFFKARNATFPDRMDSAVVAVLGFPESKKPKLNPAPTPPPKPPPISIGVTFILDMGYCSTSDVVARTTKEP